MSTTTASDVITNKDGTSSYNTYLTVSTDLEPITTEGINNTTKQFISDY